MLHPISMDKIVCHAPVTASLIEHQASVCHVREEPSTTQIVKNVNVLLNLSGMELNV